jgi:hypothetical protein
MTTQMTAIRSTLRAATCAAAALLATGCAAAHPPLPAPINTSRLGLTKPAGTVPRGVIQLETGYSRARLDQRTRHAFGETLVRLGLGPRTEVRGGIATYLSTVTPAATVQGVGDASLSVKHRLLTNAGWVPALGVTVGSTIPTGAQSVGAGEPQPEGAVAAEWRLPRGLRAMTMAAHRSAFAADDRFGQTTLAAAGRSNIGKDAVAHLEYAHVLSTRAGAPDVGHLRGGAALRLNPNLQLDGWVGRATSAGKHELVLGVGFAQRW